MALYIIIGSVHYQDTHQWQQADCVFVLRALLVRYEGCLPGCPCALVALASSTVVTSQNTYACLQTVQLHQLRNSMATTVFGKSDKEVLLELMAVDSDVALPSYSLPDPFGNQPVSSQSISNAKALMSSVEVARGPAECSLLVLVSAAANLPLVVR